MYMYIYMYIYIYMYTCIYIYMYIHIHVYLGVVYVRDVSGYSLDFFFIVPFFVFACILVFFV